ncbi:hypothetical protein HNQ51_000925 [Inhella inkyongensis]|uniref:Uncharacterized protein n=1 Tax=Inhella inkyongensis TaxID=392593 RepID=A0A840S282_9BURK|nr:hypothetical protein [Inhella inkyongensis]MBB5203632.1 hypothetical protein [Inhella inkyongensis]
MNAKPPPRLSTTPRWRQPLPWMLALALPLVAWVVDQSLGVRVEVEAKIWRREVDIEASQVQPQSDWCDKLPAAATEVERLQREDPGQAGQMRAYCRFRGPGWSLLRRAVAEGDGARTPHWPVLRLSPGIEREGQRRAWAWVMLRAADGREWQCTPPLPQWLALQPGQRLRLKVDQFGVANCASLPQPAPPAQKRPA